jgi:hypothetical protein
MLCFFGFETSNEFFLIANTLFCDVLFKEILNEFLLEGHLLYWVLFVQMNEFFCYKDNFFVVVFVLETLNDYYLHIYIYNFLIIIFITKIFSQIVLNSLSLKIFFLGWCINSPFIKICKEIFNFFNEKNLSF